MSRCGLMGPRHERKSVDEYVLAFTNVSMAGVRSVGGAGRLGK